MNKRRVCYVVCYKDPNYTRSNSLINALAEIKGVDLIVIKNKSRGFLRYFEVPPRLLWVRLKFRPDIFVVGFRAHEIFWALYPSMTGKKIIFDEFIDIHDWLVHEHGKLKENSFPVKAVDSYIKLVMRLSSVVLTDTDAHAKLAATNYGIDPKKILALPVGADEKLFYPRRQKTRDNFKVLFYGSMLPLHGLDYILGAMEDLKDRGRANGIELTLAGGRGDGKLETKLSDFKERNKLGGSLVHIPWVELDKLPEFIAGFDLVLGGPFGNTGQARRVITGKTYQLLSMAKPVVVGRIEDMNGFKDKVNCFLVNQGSASELASVISWAADNRDKLPAIGANGHKLFEKNFSAKAIANLLEQAME